jgi:hypothetical protein
MRLDRVLQCSAQQRGFIDHHCRYHLYLSRAAGQTTAINLNTCNASHLLNL